MAELIKRKHELWSLRIDVFALKTKEKPEGWKYGMVAIHELTNERLLCFDNHHGYPHIDRSSSGKQWSQPYLFVDIKTTLRDFYREAELIARQVDYGG